MPTDSEGQVVSVYQEVAVRHSAPPRQVSGVFAEILTGNSNPERQVYATYIEALTTRPPPAAGFIGWGIPL